MKPWYFYKTSIVGYGKLLDSEGKEYNVNFDDKENIKITSTTKDKPVKIPKYVYNMIKEKISQ